MKVSMNRKPFPTYTSHAGGFCWRCDLPFDGTESLVDSGYPPGNGQFAKLCKACSTVTYYDVNPNENQK